MSHQPDKVDQHDGGNRRRGSILERRWIYVFAFGLVVLILWAVVEHRYVYTLSLLVVFVFAVGWVSAERQVELQADLISRLTDELSRKSRVILMMSRALQQPRSPRSQGEEHDTVDEGTARNGED